MRYAAMLVLILAVAGCAGRQRDTTASVRNIIETSRVFVAAEKRYAARYPKALAPFARNTVRVVNPVAINPELLTIVDVRWQGTLDDLMKEAARIAGYSISAAGERSGSPILVSVVWDGMPLIGVLREAFGQRKGRAWLEIDQAGKHMTIHYGRPERSPVPHLDDTAL